MKLQTMRSLFLGLLAAFVLFAAAQTASAQGITGTITGTVSDPSGAVVPNATVTATNVGTKQEQTTQTSEGGIYTLASLPAGTYDVKVEAPNFKTFIQRAVVLGSDRTLGVNAQLEVGDAQAVVEVTSDAELLKTEEGTVGDNFTRQQFENLPVGRSATNILRVVPGVVPNPSGFSNGLSDGNINGGRATTADFNIDGVSAVNTNLTQSLFQPILEAVDELTIRTSNYSAESGRGGAVINLTTRAGTNEFHGSLFHYFQNDKLNANSFFNNRNGAARPVQRFNLFGGIISGPVFFPAFGDGGPAIYNGRNRTFFTFAYEGTRSNSAVGRTATVPTLAMRQGNFAGLGQVFDPATTVCNAGVCTRQAFQNNQIPLNRIDPRALALLQFYPEPNLPGSVNNFFFLFPTPNNQDAITTRFDHNFSDSNRLTLRYSYRKASVVDAGNAPNFPGPGGAGGTAVSSLTTSLFQNFSGSHTYVFSPNLINDFNFGYFFTHTQQFVPGQGEGFAAQLGFPGVSPDKFPQVSFTTYSAFGGGNLSDVYPARNYDINDTITWIKGRHTLKFGGNFRTLAFYDKRGTDVQFTFDTQGTYNPQTPATRANTGNSFASFLLGIPSNTRTETRNPEGFRFRYKYFAWFVQDDFKVNKKLTLNLGLRWETTTPRTEDQDQQTVFNPQTGQLDVAGQNGYPRTLRDTDLNNFQPRFGFAYSLNDKTILRGGAGIFALPTEVSGNTFTDPGPGQRALTFVANGATNVFPVTFANFAQTATIPSLTNTFALSPAVNVNYMPRKFPTAEMYQWNLNVQRELPFNVLLEVGYVGNRGVHLEFARNLNTVPIGLLTAPGTLQSKRPFPNVGNITTVRNDPIGNSNYHSLQTRVQRRLIDGVSFNLAYTFSKSIDDASDSLAFRQVGIVPVQDNYNLRAERSVSTYDRTHNFSFNVIWQLPVGKGRRYLNKGGIVNAFLGGWDVSVLGTYLSGLPLALTVNNANAITNTLGGGLRPNVVGTGCGQLPEGERSIDRWFNTANFAAPAPNTFGNASRTISCLRGPSFKTFDLLLAKQFSLTERFKLQLRGEFFNVFNIFNPGLPNTNIGNPAAGRITGAASAPRTIQTSLKLVF